MALGNVGAPHEGVKSRAVARFWVLLVKPKSYFAQHAELGSARTKLSFFLLFGIVLVHWGTLLLGLGKFYLTGQLLSAMLILGPAVGLLFFAIAGLLAFAFGNLFSKSGQSSNLKPNSIPPFPLKNMLFRKLLGTAALASLFELPILRQGKQLWAFFHEKFGPSHSKKFNSKTELQLTFWSLNSAFQVLLLLLPVIWCSIYFLEAVQFRSEFNAHPTEIFLLVLETICIGYCLHLWALALTTIRKKAYLNALVIVFGSIAIAAMVVCIILIFLLGIRLY